LFWNQGVASLLVVIGSRQVRVYSGLTLPAASDATVDKQNRLVEVFDLVSQGLELRRLTQQIELGEYFREHVKAFNPKLRVDRYLLNTLNAARNALRSLDAGAALDLATIDALLGRTVFTCYLVDRAIIGPDYFARLGIDDVQSPADLLGGRDPVTARRRLYRLFAQLQRDFNGDLFAGNLDAEAQRVGDAHIGILRRFLRGDDLGDRQLSLGFWPFDFSVLPVETISAIYESFLEAEDAEEKRKAGAYYTPRVLANLVVSTATGGVPYDPAMRFLDPACGSGIFLVTLFNLLAEEWLRRHPSASQEERVRELKGILTTNLFGVDASETACRIAALSLYLAFLDRFEPRDINRLQQQGAALPRLVLGRGDIPTEKWGGNILCRDFFGIEPPLAGQEFDVVLGNPPWARDRVSTMAAWCAEHSLPTSQGQLAQGFMWKAPQHVRPGGRICLVLPLTLLSSRQSVSRTFLSGWLATFAVDSIINLADMRRYLFERAEWPAIIVLHRRDEPNPADRALLYCAPKTEWDTLYTEVISISEADQSVINLHDLLGELQQDRPPTTWKTHLWGTARDRKLLGQLGLLPTLAQITSSGAERPARRWQAGQGFQPAGEQGESGNRKATLSPFDENQLYLDADSEAIRLIVLEGDCERLGSRYPRLRRLTTKRSIFDGPHVLVTKGGRAAFASFDVVFRHALQGIHGPTGDRNLLIFLAAVLDSKLAGYFFFHTAADKGVGRDTVLLDELLRLPFPLPEDTGNPERSADIVREVARLLQSTAEQSANSLIGRAETIDVARRAIQPLIYEYYDIDAADAILIEDTVRVWMPSAIPSRGTRNIPTLRRSRPAERIAYADRLCATLNRWAECGPYRIVAEIIAPGESGTGLVALRRAAAGSDVPSVTATDAIAALGASLDRVHRLFPDTQGSVRYLRNLTLFTDQEILLCKPLALRYWTETFALNDADAIADAILSYPLHGGPGGNSRQR
jgi:hypothetical protein